MQLQMIIIETLIEDDIRYKSCVHVTLYKTVVTWLLLAAIKTQLNHIQTTTEQHNNTQNEHYTTEQRTDRIIKQYHKVFTQTALRGGFISE